MATVVSRLPPISKFSLRTIYNLRHPRSPTTRLEPATWWISPSIPPPSDSSDSPRRFHLTINLVTRSKILSHLPRKGRGFIRLLWISKLKCVLLDPPPRLCVSDVSSPFVTILFHRWAKFGERFEFIHPPRRRKSWGTIATKRVWDFGRNRGNKNLPRLSKLVGERIAGNRDVSCVLNVALLLTHRSKNYIQIRLTADRVTWDRTWYAQLRTGRD